MDSPELDAEEPSSAELVSIGDERPTNEARLRIEKGDITLEAVVPAEHTSRLLDVTVAVSLIAGAVFAPMMTLKASADHGLEWVTTVMVGAQLVILILVGVSAFARRPAGRTG